MDDGKASPIEQPVQSSGDSKPAPTKSLLPQADSKRPDPLQMPAQYDRRPVDEKPSAQKTDTMLVPAVAAASSTALKPAVATGATTVQPVQAPVPPVRMSVPLGAQSIIQAGDPGPGGVRYMPVPMVTLPEVRRAPMLPMTSQAYTTSGTVPTATAGSQANAFTSTPSRPAYTQATNAFGTGTPMAPAPASGLSMPVSGSTGRMAQTLPLTGSNNATNSTVMSAGFQGSALSNQTVPATYQSALSPAPLCPSLSAVKATPENIQQMVTALRDSLYPSQRECAAENMAAVDWRSHPHVVQALTTAAREDPAATVRVSCIRCLAKMRANTAPVFAVVRDMKNDIDPRVRQEAEQALSILTSGQK